MVRAAGYVVRFSKERLSAFQGHDHEMSSFGEPVREFTCSRTAPLLGIVISNGRITHVARAKRGVRAGTDLRRLNLTDVLALSVPLKLSAVVRRLPKRVKRWASDRLSHGGLLAPASFAAVVDALVGAAPELSGRLRRFGQERQDRIARLSAPALDALGKQKLAVSTAVMLAGLSREDLQDWDPVDEQPPSSFLDGLGAARLREDPMVINDLSKMPGYELLRTMRYGAALFSGPNARLTVVLANRLPLEEQTGADLIYFNETYRSFVMVQYKAMEHEGDATMFRLPNAQLDEELARMAALRDALRDFPRQPGTQGFRLNDCPFFLKFCPRIVFDPDDSGLTKGMYIPLDYWNLLANTEALSGPRGGRAVSYRNVGRYLDNSEFAALVSKAWIGTAPEQSDVLEDAIRVTIKTGKAVVIGIKTDVDESRPRPEEQDPETQRESDADGILEGDCLWERG